VRGMCRAAPFDKPRAVNRRVFPGASLSLSLSLSLFHPSRLIPAGDITVDSTRAAYLMIRPAPTIAPEFSPVDRGGRS